MKNFYLLAHGNDKPDIVRGFLIPAYSLKHAHERFYDFQRGYNIGAGVKVDWRIDEISTKARRVFTYTSLF